jgi:hypothetical protein
LFSDFNVIYFLTNRTCVKNGLCDFYPRGLVAGDGDAIYSALKNASKEMGHFSVYRKEEILERWHYKKNRRAPPIFVLADESYAFDDMYQYVDEYEKLTNKRSKFHCMNPSTSLYSGLMTKLYLQYIT